MTAATLRRDPGNALFAIADFARSLSLQALVTIEGLALASGLAFYAFSPRAWPLEMPCVAITSFALWGICDRLVSTLTSHREKNKRRALRIIGRVVAAAGVLSALLSVYLMIGWLMGVYIS
ncbi:MAG TPA: hypothetical protein VF042_11400 [Gemmatimonadaceae bacterium]